MFGVRSEMDTGTPDLANVESVVVPASRLTPRCSSRNPRDETRLLQWSRFSFERTSKTSKFLRLVPDNHVSFSVPAPHTHRDVVIRIAVECRIPVESLSDVLNQPVFTRGQAIFGYVGDQLDEIARNYTNMRWWVSDRGLNMAIVSSDERPGESRSVLIAQRAARRRAVVMPILKEKGWSSR